MSCQPPDTVLAQIVHAVAEILDVPRDRIGIETRAADIEAWDSFGHVRIVLALEQLFDIELSMADIEAADSIAGLCAVAERAKAPRETIPVA